MANENNDKKMPQGNQNQNQKPGMKPDLDQKKPQSGSDIGKEHGFDKKEKQSSVKPDVDKGSDVKPQSKDTNVVDDDDKITQRSSRSGNEPLRQK
jgi:hypothetical protein